MTSKEIINISRSSENSIKELSKYFEFKKNLALSASDDNLQLRTQIVNDLLVDFTDKDLKLIQLLFDEELKCELETRRHDNLYQLCFYLYEIGNLSDVYRIYTAKYKTKNMDVGSVIDSSMLYMSHKINEVIEFVKKDSTNNQTELITILEELKINPVFEDEQSYKGYINRYFRGATNTPTKTLKKWWQIWK